MLLSVGYTFHILLALAIYFSYCMLPMTSFVQATVGQLSLPWLTCTASVVEVPSASAGVELSTSAIVAKLLQLMPRYFQNYLDVDEAGAVSAASVARAP